MSMTVSEALDVLKRNADGHGSAIYEDAEACRFAYDFIRSHIEREVDEPRRLGNPCSVCFGSGTDAAGKPCPFAPHEVKNVLTTPGEVGAWFGGFAACEKAEREVDEAMVERACAAFRHSGQATFRDDMKAALIAALEGK